MYRVMWMWVHMFIGHCKKCVVFVGNLNVTYKYILYMAFNGRLIPYHIPYLIPYLIIFKLFYHNATNFVKNVNVEFV